MRTLMICTAVSSLLLSGNALAQVAAKPRVAAVVSAPPAPPATAPPATAPPDAPSPSVPSSTRVNADTDTGGDGTPRPTKDRGAVDIGVKAGGLVAFSGLNPNARAVLELGYIFPWMHRSFGLVLDVGYAVPKTDGTQGGDSRVSGSAYNWHLSEQELTIMPTLVYRLTSLGKFVPYAGIGPRIYLLQSNVKGDVNGVPISETTEQSTKLGVGVPLGIQYDLGPGGLTAELLLEYGPLDHTATGSSNTGAASLLLGYRFLL